MYNSDSSMDSDSSHESTVPKKPKLVDTRNFYIENGLAFTKQGSHLIFNIFAHNIPKELTENDLKSYFTTFEGEVKMLEGTRVAYVHFKRPEKAACVLTIGQHTIDEQNCSSSFSVMACDSWLQTANSYVSLLDLDDDIIVHLFKYLSLKDQLAFMSSHIRFLNPFKMYAKTYLKQITDNELREQALNSTEVSLFFQTVGEYLQSLLIYGDFESILCPNGFNIIASNCTNLRYLVLEERPKKMTIELFNNFITKLTKLQALRLMFLTLDDECFHALKQLPELTHLTLMECINITGSNLHLLPNLEKFCLSSLFLQLNSTALSTMPKLYSLSLTVGLYSHNDDDDCPLKTSWDKIVDNLASTCKNVEILTLNLPHTNLRGIIEMPKLRSLKFRVQPKNMNADFRALVEAKKNHLTTLKVIDVFGKFSEKHYQLISQLKFLETLHLPEKSLDDSGYSINDDDLKALSALENLTEFKIIGRHDITNNGLLEFVNKCRKLKWVNIMKTCISNEFAHKLLPVLKKNSRRPNGCITFLVWKSKMNKSENFPVDFSFKEINKLAIFIFDELFTTLKSYERFDDKFNKDNSLFVASFCDDS